jgi:tetratricopeptide (TPR) repeat protein
LRRFLRAIPIFCFLGVWFFSGLASADPANDQRKEVSLRYYRGVVNFEGGKYENALAEFQAVAAVNPYYKDTQKYIEMSVKQLEQYREDLFKEMGPSGNRKDFDFYFLGKSYYEKGNYNKALEAFKAVLAKNPKDKFALYYAQLCRDALGISDNAQKGKKLTPRESKSAQIVDMDNEISYVKTDLRDQQEKEFFLESKAQRRAERSELIHRKEKQLVEQESLLEEEKEDYLAEAKITKRAKKVKNDTEKWKNMKDKLASEQVGVPAMLTEFPEYMGKAESYYRAMKEGLRLSRWNSAGLNAIQAATYYCDALLIYFYNIKSFYPKHENINRLLTENVKRSDTIDYVFRMRSVLNLKKISEEEDKPFSRSQALFLSDQVERIAEWCKSILP